MRRRAFISLILAVVLILSVGCGRNTEEHMPKNAVKIYCLDKSGSELVWEYYVPKRTRLNEQLYELLSMLKTEPENRDYTELLGTGVYVKDSYLGADGQLILDFDSSYMKLETIPELLCRAGIVKTLCQMDGIEYIEFYVDGQPLMHGEAAVGQMTAEDFIDNTGSDVNFRQTVTITVYYADMTGKMMSDSLLLVESNGTRTVEEIAVRQVLDGPLESSSDLQATIPEGTVLNKISVKDGVAYVDLSADIMNHMEHVSDEVVIYSIVNTLCEISNITKVQITVDGNPIKIYGNVNMSQLLERRTDLITTEKVESLNDDKEAGDGTE